MSSTASFLLNRFDGAYTQVLFNNREISRAAITMQELLWGTQASVTAAADNGKRVEIAELERLDGAFHDALAEATRGIPGGEAGQAEQDLIRQIGQRFADSPEYIRQASEARAERDGRAGRWESSQ